MLSKFFLWIVAAYGISTIIVYGGIFQGIRNWIARKSSFFGDLVNCLLCTSTWVGFFLSIFLGSLTGQVFHTNFFLNLFIDAGFTAGSVWALNAIIDWFEEAASSYNKNRIL